MHLQLNLWFCALRAPPPMPIIPSPSSSSRQVAQSQSLTSRTWIKCSICWATLGELLYLSVPHFLNCEKEVITTI